MKDHYFLPMRQEFALFSEMLENCLTHGLRQLTRDVKSNIRTLNFRSEVTFCHHAKHRMTFGEGHYAA